jgi:flavin-dependent dehydrogenase
VNRDPRIDLAIVGAGPAGTLLALLAARAGLRVLLMERVRFPRPKPCGGVLSPRAVKLLERANLREQIEAAGAVPIRTIHLVSRHGARAVLPYGDGLALERRHLDMLLLEATAASGARVETGVDVEVDLATPPGAARLRRGSPGKQRRAVHATWVIGAGGRRCPVRRALNGASGPLTSGPSRASVALAAVLDGTCAPDATCEMHVGAPGYCGIAACGQGRTCVGYVLPAPVWRRLGHDPARALAEALASRGSLAAGAGRLRVAAGPWASGSLCAAPPVQVPAGVALAGDSLARMEPITGEGMAEAFTAAWRIADFLVRSPDPHTAYVLHRQAARAGRRVRRRAALAAALGRAPLCSRAALSLLTRLPALGAYLGVPPVSASHPPAPVPLGGKAGT